MSEENNDKNIERKREDEIYTFLLGYAPKLKESLNELEYYSNDMDMNLENLPNIVITTNNKLVELGHIFGKSGMLFFTEKDRNGSYRESFLGKAIKEDFLNKIFESLTYLDYCIQYIYSALITSGTVELKENAFKTLVGKIKQLTPNEKLKRELLTRTSITKAKICLSGYIAKDKQIWNYDLERDVIDSIMFECKARNIRRK